MHKTRTVVDSPHFVVRSVECADHHVDWSPPEPATAVRFVLVRRGRFRLDSGGRRVMVDPTSGYLQPLGHEARFSHPAGGDVCTSITLCDDRLTAGIRATGTLAVPVDARLELAHRMLLRGDAEADFAAAEAVVGLLQLALRREPDDLPAPGAYDLADRARGAILAGEPDSTSLIGLARQLQTSPAHLSRTFRYHAGMSISRYRNRVRVSRAMQHLEDGASDLADLAITLGFSDQAHFTRVVRRELASTPSTVSTLLARTLSES